MTFDRKRELGGYFAFGAGIALAFATFALRCWRRDDLPIEWALALLCVGALLCVVGAWITPQFWWGRSRFTTPLKEPSHEQFIGPAQQGIQADASSPRRLT